MSTIKLKYGNTNTYFIDGLLFDTDMPGLLNMFYKVIKQNKLSLCDIKYIVCSHYHPDHMGLVSTLMKQGIKLVVIENQYQYIHSSDNILNRQYQGKYNPINESNASIITVEESRHFLRGLGINGEIIVTTSHSKDGIALILDCGECFVGDVEPLQYIDGYSDNELLKKDWNTIMVHRPKIIHFGHNIDQIL